MGFPAPAGTSSGMRCEVEILIGRTAESNKTCICFAKFNQLNEMFTQQSAPGCDSCLATCMHWIKMTSTFTQAMDFFAMRRISAASLKRNGIMEQQVFMGKRLGDDLPLTKCIAFPYMRGEVLLGVKYLSPDKKWKHVRTAVLHSMLDDTLSSGAVAQCYLLFLGTPSQFTFWKFRT